MTDQEIDIHLKQAAIQDFCRAVRYEDRSITSMSYDSDKEAVQIKYGAGSLWVDATEKSILEMLAAVLKEVAA